MTNIKDKSVQKIKWMGFEVNVFFVAMNEGGMV